MTSAAKRMRPVKNSVEEVSNRVLTKESELDRELEIESEKFR